MIILVYFEGISSLRVYYELSIILYSTHGITYHAEKSGRWTERIVLGAAGGRRQAKHIMLRTAVSLLGLKARSDYLITTVEGTKYLVRATLMLN